jgi:protocatechuate 4,5-dioxygenase beta chain
MARIIGGIGTSHVPTIAMAFDKGKREDPDWKPLFQGYEGVARWLEEKRPDVLFFCFNDHATSFFFDHYPTFALGVSDEYAIADEGVGPRRIPPLRGHAALSRHIARSLVDAEFDISIFQDVPLDHGLHSPLTMMWPSQPDWPGRVVPLVVNVIQQPLPKPSRCFALGKALRKAIESYPENLKVAMVGTGGLSHQMIGDRAGFNDERWDREFLELIDRDPERLARMSIEDFMRLGGNEGAEIIMWLIMRGALAPNARKIHQNYYLPMTTAMAVAVFE